MAFSQSSRFDNISRKTHEYPEQLENISKKERFGLFSQPPGLSIGDGFSRPKTCQEPRGVLTNPNLQSQVEPSLFQFPNFTTINDPYTESFKAKQIVDKQREDAIPHKQPFKHTDKQKTKVGSQYEHMKEYNNKVFQTRDPITGAVVTSPRGFYTQPHKKGFGNTTTGHLFGPVAYSTDPYDRPKEFDVQDRATHKSKILNQQKQFTSTQKRNNLFESNLETFGNYRPVTEGRKRSYDYQGVPHKSNWRNGDNAKKGYNKTIGRFPEYSEEGKQRQFQKTQTLFHHNKTWKPNYNGTLAKPSPAISHMSRNFNKMSSYKR